MYFYYSKFHRSNKGSRRAKIESLTCHIRFQIFSVDRTEAIRALEERRLRAPSLIHISVLVPIHHEAIRALEERRLRGNSIVTSFTSCPFSSNEAIRALEERRLREET